MATACSVISGVLTLSLFAAGAALSPAYALPVAFTNEADWIAALSGASVNVENFESSPVGQLPAGSSDIGLFNVSLNAVDPDGLNAILNPGFVNGTRDMRGSIYDDVARGPTQISFIFDGPVRAFAGDFFDATSADRLTVTVNGTLFNVFDYLGAPGNGFFGLVDVVPFGQISFGTQNAAVQPNEAFNIDNVRISLAAISIPEPATLTLFLAGLGWLGLARRPSSPNRS